MTVPLLPCKLSDVRAEFGGLVSTPLSAYVRGGAFVPVQTLGGIPAALPLNLGVFAGANYPAALTFDHVEMDGAYSVTTQVCAPDLSTLTIVVARTKVVNGGSSMFEAVECRALFNITGAIAPSITIRLPATQPRDGAGYWKQIFSSAVHQSNTPAAFIPIEDYSTFEHFWHVQDINTTYQGEFRVNTRIPVGNDPTPPQVSGSPQTMAGVQAAVRLTVTQSMNIGTAAPPGSQMTWNLRSGTNTFVEFPIIIDVYDGAILRASYPMLVHFELNALLTFNPS